MRGDEIALEDPRAPDVRALIDAHLAFANAQGPDDVQAFALEGLLDPSVSFFTLRRDGQLLAIGALVMLDADHAEVKSMHTAEAARGQGAGRAMLDHLLDVARSRGVRRVSLETGTKSGFAPAHRLYAGAGFEPCEFFGSHADKPNSMCMTRLLDGI